MSSKPVLLLHRMESVKQSGSLPMRDFLPRSARIVRALHADIDYAADFGADSVHLVVPVSDLHIAKKMRKTREQVAAMAYDAVEYAKSRGLIVELSGEDASRADQQFLQEIFSEGVQRGADRLCFCDTVGLLTPEKVAEFIPPLAKIAPLSIHCHDDLGFAVTNTMAALKCRCLLCPRDREWSWRAGRKYPVRGGGDGP